MNELDIYRSANILTKSHGDKAEREAKRRANALLARGDIEGNLVWVRLVRAVQKLQNTEHEGLHWGSGLLLWPNTGVEELLSELGDQEALSY